MQLVVSAVGCSLDIIKKKKSAIIGNGKLKCYCKDYKMKVDK